jgi:hypothetical protein
MCRQVFEAITESGSPFDGGEHHRAGGGGGRSQLLSAAAAVFGTLGLQGRVSFDDAVPTGCAEGGEVNAEPIRLSVAYPPRREAGRRFYGPIPPGVEQQPSVQGLAIPAGTVLRTLLRFRSLTQEELGLVLTSLGLESFTPRLGGGKYDDFGWVRFRVAAFRLRPRGLAGVATWERSPETVAELVEKCRGQASLGGTAKATLELLGEKLQFAGTRASGGRGA